MTAEQAKRARDGKARTTALDEDEESSANADGQEELGRYFPEENFEPSTTPGYALGLFSIGLGLAEIVAPRQLARLLGVKPSAATVTTMRMFAVREIAVGVGMLLQPRGQTWAWARVAGDMLGVAALTRASRSSTTKRPRVAAMAAATIAIAGLDIARARQLGPRRKPRAGTDMQSSARAAIEVHRSVTVNLPIIAVYEFWRNFENFPQFMDHLESVTDGGNGFSQWKAKAPAGTSVTWEAELVEDQPNERIAWQSTAESQIQNSGSVRFVEAPGDRGTEVHVELRYSPPAGKLGAIVAKLFGEEPTLQIASDLRRFKQVMETGEVLLSDASMHKGIHPARPSEEYPVRPYEAERRIVVERSADAAEQSSNREREPSEAQQADDRYNDELANHRSTF